MIPIGYGGRVGRRAGRYRAGATNLGITPLRIDKLLWHIRIFKSRSGAQNQIEKGRVRMNGARVERTSALVHIGDTITLPLGDAVLTIRILNLMQNRVAADVARTCYEIL